MNCEKTFEHIVKETAGYLKRNPKLKAMVLGISGGIDSTVCAAICSEVSARTGVPLIGRSITMNNTSDEVSASKLVGEAFCNDFKELNLKNTYSTILDDFTKNDPEIEFESTTISRGNIQARLRMMYLYNIAGIKSGLVIDTDNLTEHYLGFFTIHGDVGDFNPIGGLWKTEIFELAKWLVEVYYKDDADKAKAVAASAKLLPTDGLGISKSDYDQIGATMENTDKILQKLVYVDSKDLLDSIIEEKPIVDFSDCVEVERPDNVKNVIRRMNNTRFKRYRLPLVVDTYVDGLGTKQSLNIY